MIDPCSLSEGDRVHVPLEVTDGQLLADHDIPYEVVVSGEHRLEDVPPADDVLIEITEVGDKRAEAKVVSAGLSGIVDGLEE